MLTPWLSPVLFIRVNLTLLRFSLREIKYKGHFEIAIFMADQFKKINIGKMKQSFAMQMIGLTLWTFVLTEYWITQDPIRIIKCNQF
jgi:hypothetical protein